MEKETTPQLPITKNISVIVPTYDSAQFLGACLKSIRAQCPEPYELIVVDDVRTRDATRQIANTFESTLIVSNANMPASRNEGAAAAHGDILIHVDSDMTLQDGLLRAVCKAFEDCRLDGMVLYEQVLPTSLWSRARAIDKDIAYASRSAVATRVVRADVFRRIGGYNEGLLAGEDSDFHKRLLESGAAIKYLKSPCLTHDESQTTLLTAFRKKYVYGKTAYTYEACHGPLVSGRQGRRRLLLGFRPAWNVDSSLAISYVLLKVSDLAGYQCGRLYSAFRRMHTRHT